MIYVTGDTHADFTRFSKAAFPEQKEMNKNDFVIVCGDFGGVWDSSKYQKYELDQLNSRSFTTLFVDGNHENFDMLNEFPVTEWHGGKVHYVRSNVIHLMRGQVYDIQGKKFFTMGGAQSHDIDDGILEPKDKDFVKKLRHFRDHGGMFRINHISWWKQELPSQEEYDEAMCNLEKANWKVDYAITHCAPTDVQATLGGGHYKRDALTDFLQTVADGLDFDRWIFGHYHSNRSVLRKYVLLYEQIIRIL